ncbi:efflux RND transporter permease subunit, partial [Streptomyces galilaeus]|uniref:efflux RND transporter permease subunit n=1 Tax=Streptomyces galilaeus TaxID=33899 RepID=UPI0038F6AF78
NNKKSGFEVFHNKYALWLERFMKGGNWKSWVFVISSIFLLVLLFSSIGKEIFPKVDAGQAQVRLRLPTGTRLERTEEATQK